MHYSIYVIIFAEHINNLTNGAIKQPQVIVVE